MSSLNHLRPCSWLNYIANGQKGSASQQNSCHDWKAMVHKKIKNIMLVVIYNFCVEKEKENFCPQFFKEPAKHRCCWHSSEWMNEWMNTYLLAYCLLLISYLFNKNILRKLRPTYLGVQPGQITPIQENESHYSPRSSLLLEPILV